MTSVWLSATTQPVARRLVAAVFVDETVVLDLKLEQDRVVLARYIALRGRIAGRQQRGGRREGRDGRLAPGAGTDHARTAWGWGRP